MPTPCYISITGQTQGNITAGAFTADSVGNIYVQGHRNIIVDVIIIQLSIVSLCYSLNNPENCT